PEHVARHLTEPTSRFLVGLSAAELRLRRRGLTAECKPSDPLGRPYYRFASSMCPRQPGWTGRHDQDCLLTCTIWGFVAAEAAGGFLLIAHPPACSPAERFCRNRLG